VRGKILFFWSSLEHYFSSTLIPWGSLDGRKKYVFGFHPHGIYPLTSFWGTQGPSFRKAYPGLEVDICGASVVFFTPVLRDLVMWLGGREVSRVAIERVLASGSSVLLVPGGQREMRHSTGNRNKFHVVTRHKGFVKIAIEHGIDLVPIFSFGEDQIIENIRMPKMQAVTTRFIGYGFPFVPFGRWYSPLPNPVSITVIIGPPISVGAACQNPSLERIDQLHQRYYHTLRELFEKFKAIAGFPDSQLIYENE